MAECTKIEKEQIEEMLSTVNKLAFDLRTNMTSITRYVKHKREEHPNLTEGQFIDRHLAYRALAEVAVDNILKCLNDNDELRQIERLAGEKGQYVECSICGKKLYFGEKVLTKPHYVGIYCSPNCFANDFAIDCCRTPLTKEFAVRKEVSVKGETYSSNCGAKMKGE